MIGAVINAMEKGWIPDPMVRLGIRQLNKQRLQSFRQLTQEQLRQEEKTYVELLRQSPVAVHTKDANDQHYEVPPVFFNLVLGPHLKYSSGYWPDQNTTLAESEAAALNETCERAELADGQRILELGCGWGSLSLTMARRYPHATIVALSNSAPQRGFIEARAKLENIKNLTVLTRNVAEVKDLENEFPLFDRVVSVEMFEHMKNYEVLMQRISQWLKPGGKLFVHIFTHRDYSYPFETEGEDNWMGKYFFTGGQMPSHSLLKSFQSHLQCEKDWVWNGTHYAKTSRAWLNNMDTHREKILSIFTETYGASEAKKWFQRWRIFFMACEELFGFKRGAEWGVSHYRFVKQPNV